jgi:hypothetical protein
VKITCQQSLYGTLLQIEMLTYPQIQYVSPPHTDRDTALRQAFGCFRSSIPPRCLLFFREDGEIERWHASIAFWHCYLCGVQLNPDNWKACGVYDDEPNRICDSCHNTRIANSTTT